jgi:hypothetical protein
MGTGRLPGTVTYATDPGRELNLLRELGVEAPVIYTRESPPGCTILTYFDPDILGRETNEAEILRLGREALARLQQVGLAPQGSSEKELVEWNSPAGQIGG